MLIFAEHSLMHSSCWVISQPCMHLVDVYYTCTLHCMVVVALQSQNSFNSDLMTGLQVL
jgi:hypothetical protein